MIWIYGGAWVIGSDDSQFYELQNLVANGQVIGVSVNYRLGPLGFLSLGQNSSIRGNYGLFDQELGIRWVYENIERFGGDKNRITVFGESAGGASTTIQMQNPRLRGIVKRGIAESGSFNAPWAFLNQQAMSKQVRKLAGILHDKRNDNYCQKDDDKVSLAHCFKSSKPKDMVDAISLLDFQEILTNKFQLDIPWAPVVDNEILLEIGSELQIEIFNEKELLIGHNNHDGYLFTAPALSRVFLDAEDGLVIDYDDNKFGQHELLKDFCTKFLVTNNYSTDLAIQEACYFRYNDYNKSSFDDETDDKWARERAAEAHTDVLFREPTAGLASSRYDAIEETAPATYFYQFSEPDWKKETIRASFKFEKISICYRANIIDEKTCNRQFGPISSNFSTEWSLIFPKWLGAMHVGEIRYIMHLPEYLWGSGIMFDGKPRSFSTPELPLAEDFRFLFFNIPAGWYSVEVSELQVNGTIFETTAEQRYLGSQMQKMWLSFAKDGAPKGDFLEKWPDYVESGGDYYELSYQSLSDPVRNDKNRIRERWWWSEFVKPFLHHKEYTIAVKPVKTEKPNYPKIEEINPHSVIFPENPETCTNGVPANGGCIESGFEYSRPQRITVQEFRGINFGHSTRFQRPTTITPSDTNFKADTWGKQCPKSADSSRKYYPLVDEVEMSDDCLNLNLYRRTPGSNDKPKPVLVWIFGGGNMYGANYESWYQAFTEFVARNDVIVVVPNYRVGVFGYMNANEENDDSANLFFVDIWQSLLWVRHNIESFGGDKGKITLGGQSSGSMAISLIVKSPWVFKQSEIGEPLFQKVIMQSGIYSNHTFSDGAQVRKDVMRKVGCESFECLLDVDMNLLTNSTLSITPTLDSNIIPMQPRDLQNYAIENNFAQNIEYLVGYTSQESSALVQNAVNLFVRSTSFEDFWETLQQILVNLNSEMKPRSYSDEQMRASLLQYFPFESFNEFTRKVTDLKTLKNSMLTLINDNDIFAPDLSAIQQLSKSGCKVFFYNFDFVTDNFRKDYDWLEGAGHGNDLIYMTGGVYSEMVRDLWNSGVDYSRSEEKMGDLMMGVWAKFIGKNFGEDNIYSPLLGDTWHSYKYENCTSIAGDLSDNQCQIYGEFNSKSSNDPEIKTFFRQEGVSFWNDYVPKLGRLDFLGEVQPEFDYPELLEVEIPDSGSVFHTITGVKKPNGVRFFKIPFATIQKRFSHSEFKPVTSNMMLGSEKSNNCVIFDKNYAQYSGVEDCLFLDMILPVGHNTESFDIPVFIDFGASDISRILTTKNDVIVVKINYRTGPLGFLNAEQFGLQDQINAVRWVSSYIEYFGGNKETLSVIGSGQAGFFADLLAQSQKLRELGFSVKNVATIDGTALSPWLTSIEFQHHLYRQTVDTLERFKSFDSDPRSELESMDLTELSHIFSQVEQTQGPHLYPTSFQPVTDGNYVMLTIRDWIKDFTSVDQKRIHFVSEFAAYEQVLSRWPKLYSERNLRSDSMENVDEFMNEAVHSVSQFFINADQFGERVYTAIKSFYQLDDSKSMNEATQLVARMMTDVIYTVPMLETLNLHQDEDKNQLQTR